MTLKHRLRLNRERQDAAAMNGAIYATFIMTVLICWNVIVTGKQIGRAHV